ncbi:MAG TPA: thioredoxin domain-containing protein [Ardenticatenaceae bacterium]|nr:thioredoxin domain-containing protein [Ardenticatenaceae bacterium]
MLETEPLIIRDFVEPGHVRLIFSPILDFANSPRLTEAAYCAGDQGKFWEMHDVLFANQGNLYSGDVDPLVRGYAEQLGLDLGTFDQCLASNTHLATIQEHHRLAREAGVRVRPSFRIGERRIEGALPYPQFQQLLEEAVTGGAE